MFLKILKALFFLFAGIIFSSCIVDKGKIEITSSKKKAELGAVVTNVQVLNNQIILTGTHLNSVTNFKIKDGSTLTTLTIESQSDTSIVANTMAHMTLVADKVFDFILSNANAAATFTVDFSLCDSKIGGKAINCLAPPTDKDVLSYDATTDKWKPRQVTGLSYLGTFSAATNPATGPAIGATGAYYVISADGNIGAVAYHTGDWLVSNGTVWQKVDNSTTVLSVFTRTGNVVAQEGDYTLDQLDDVNAPTPATGNVLQFDGTEWTAQALPAGGTVTTVSVTPPLIVATATTTPALSIAQANGSTNGYLTSANWTTFNNKEPAITAAAVSPTTKYYRGDKTFVTLDSSVVTENTNLYFNNARAIGATLDTFNSALTGAITATDTIVQAFGRAQNQINTLTSGGSSYLLKSAADTLSGAVSLTGTLTTAGVGDIVVATTPLTGTSAINKSYADGKLDKTAGGTVAGIVTLDNDLKIKAGSNYVTVKGNAASAAYNFILPVSAGTSGYVLQTDGTGVLSWVSPAAASISAGTVTSSHIADGAIVDADINAAANITATKLGTGVVDNTEFNYLNGVTSAIQTQLTGKQTSDATLTALAAFNSNGILVQTTADTFVARTATGTANRIIVTNGDGVSGNPTFDLDTTLFPSPAVGDVGNFLRASGADAATWTALGSSDVTTALGFTPVNKSGETIASGTFLFNGAALLRTLDPIGGTDVANKQYVDSYGQWTKSGSDIYRTSGNVGVGISTPVQTTAGRTYVSVKGSAGAGMLELTQTATDADAVRVGGIQFSDSNSSSTGKLIGFIGSSTSGATANQRGGRLDFATKADNVDGLVERMRIDSNGRVGIGTVDPVATLHLNTAAQTTGVWEGNGLLIKDDTTANSGVGIYSRNSTEHYITSLVDDVNSYLIIGVRKSSVANQVDALTIRGSGNVGIGTTAPLGKLDIVGQSRSISSTGAPQINATAAVDWNNGNTQTMSSACTTTAVTNMLDGGTYLLAVTETGTTQCTFAQSGLTFYYSPANGARTSGQRTVYSFQRIGTDVYVSWIAGFQ